MEAWFDSGLQWGQGHWTQQSWELQGVLAWVLSKEFGLRPNYWEGTQPHPSAENWIKDLLSMALPMRARPRFPTASPSHQEASTASYPYHQRADGIKNHNHRKLIKLMTWIIALSKSMELWGMPCRATQDTRVMVESSDKMWSIAEENDKPFSILALRTPWTVWKGKMIGHWKRSSPVW